MIQITGSSRGNLWISSFANMWIKAVAPQKQYKVLGSVLAVLMLASQPLWAGWSFKIPWKSTAQPAFTRQIPSSKMKKILQERVYLTRQRFPSISHEQQHFVSKDDLPVKEIIKWHTKGWLKSPYNDLPFWHKLSERDRYNYFLAANNRASRKAITERLQAVQKIREHVEELWNTKRSFSPQSYDQLLLQMIPPETQYILLGEEHDFMQIQLFVANFLQAYRQKYPERQIIFLTEFLPAEADYSKVLKLMLQYSPAYGQVMLWALTHGISVKGLEIPHVFFQDTWAVGDPAFGADYNLYSMWVLPEGIRLRNRFWLQEIKKWREQYPQAVFIIYAGMDHVAYNTPFSIAKELPSDGTFVAQLLPEVGEQTVGYSLDKVGGKQYPFGQQNILSWESPALRRIAGFDIRMQVPSSGK